MKNPLNSLLAICLATILGGASGNELIGNQTSKTAALIEQPLQAIQTVSSLRSIHGSQGLRLLVMGYSADNDGGQGIFAWSPTFSGADDGGVHVIPTGQVGAGAWERQFTGAVRPEWFGVKCNSFADDTTAFQKVVNYVTANKARVFFIELSDCTLRLTAPITVTGSLRIVGQGVAPYDGVIGTPGGGSWLLFDHAGVGINVAAGRVISGVMFEKFGTRRNQPDPAPGWAPASYDFDFVVTNADASFVDVMLLNPTKGIKHDKGNAGRLTVERLRGQPLQVGIEVSESYDTFRANNVHFWPFWRDDKNVHAYTRGNLDAFRLYRVDNPMLSNVFTIFARAGIRLSENSQGRVSKLHLVNADLDRGTFGIWVDSSVKKGVTVQADNVSIEGESGAADTKGIFDQGSNTRMSFGNLRIDISGQNAIRIEGTGNKYRVNNLEIIGYDRSAAKFPAVEVTAGNSIMVTELPLISGGGAGPKYGGAGSIRAKLAQGKIDATTNSSGDIVVTHGAGVVPELIVAQLISSSPLHWSVVSATATSFTIRTYTATGAPLANSMVSYYWHAEK